MNSDLESVDECTSSGGPATTAPIGPSHIQVFIRDRETLSNMSKVAQDILHNICERDDRFLFIKAALEEFLNGRYGVHHRLSMNSKLIDYLSGPEDQPIEAGEDILLQYLECMQGGPGTVYNHRTAFRDIIASIIFELLSVFGIHITTEKAQVRLETSTLLQLLDQLHTMSRDLLPQSIQQSTSKHDNDEVKASKLQDFNYYVKIDKTIDQVRVIELLPGSEDDPIKCHLMLCDIHGGGIKEALSYVWGTEKSEKCILVSQQSYPDQHFSVKENLYRILHGLRLPDATRTIWIDAICIDQSNPQERIHQMRLMRDIYTYAQSVIIWLGTDQASSDANSYMALFPGDSGGLRYMSTTSFLFRKNVKNLSRNFAGP